MFFRPNSHTKHFESFKSGNIDGLTLIVKDERDRLFDYVMRMTGQLVRASEVTDEALATAEQVADESDTFQEFLVTLYKTSRTFASDIWNADTSKLENSAYGSSSNKEIVALQKVEQLVRTLSPQNREILILRERYGFALDEVAEIVGLASSDVELYFAQALNAVEEGLPDYLEKVPEFLGKMMLFLLPKYEGPATQNLSLIMNDFKKTNRLGSSPWRFVRLSVYLILIGFCYYYRVSITSYFTEVILPTVSPFLGIKTSE